MMKRIIQIFTIVICCFTYSLVRAQYTTTFEYDSLNRLVKVDYPNGQRVEFAYDVLGNRISQTVSQLCAIQVVVSPEGSGTVSGVGNYEPQSEVTLTATPNDGFTFVNWTEDGEEVCAEASYTFTAVASRQLVANFGPNLVTKTYELAQGWNWWSPTVLVGVEDLETALNDNGLRIKSQDLGEAQYENGSWSNTIESIILGQMYKIETNATCTLTLTGVLYESATVTIAPGYNWFGFLGEEQSATITQVFADFAPAAGDKIISQNEGFAVFNGTEWKGTLSTLVPGKGYVYVSNDTQTKTLVIQ